MIEPIPEELSRFSMDIRLADRLFIEARLAQLAGDMEKAESYRSRAEAIYARIEGQL